MKVDAIALQLRPRAMYEATDLGVRLVQAHARSVWASYAPVWALVALLAAGSAGLAPWAPSLLIFWLKPWMDRTLLFVLSRAVFGESTRFNDVWAAQSTVWWQQLALTLTTRRLSFWRAYTLPAPQLEGQRGKAERARRVQLLNGQRGAACAMHCAFGQVESMLLIGAIALAAWLIPDNLAHPSLIALMNDDGDSSGLLITAAYALIVLLVEPFYVGAGFAMYLNRRVELEAWDIEQEFRLAFAV